MRWFFFSLSVSSFDHINKLFLVFVSKWAIFPLKCYNSTYEQLVFALAYWFSLSLSHSTSVDSLSLIMTMILRVNSLLLPQYNFPFYSLLCVCVFECECVCACGISIASNHFTFCCNDNKSNGIGRQSTRHHTKRESACYVCLRCMSTFISRFSTKDSHWDISSTGTTGRCKHQHIFLQT